MDTENYETEAEEGRGRGGDTKCYIACAGSRWGTNIAVAEHSG